MKCPNCGCEIFKENFCPVCGINVQNITKPDFAQNAQPDFTQNTQPVQNGFVSQNPQADSLKQPFSAQSNSTVPPFDNQPNTYAQQPNGAVNFNASKQKKANKALPIILSICIGLVIVAGIAIAVYSSVTYNKSYAEVFVDSLNNDTYDNNLYYDYDYNDYSTSGTYSDDEVYEVGETYSCDAGNITLESVELIDEKFANESNNIIKVVYTYENTTVYSYNIYTYSDFYFNQSKNMFDSDIECLYTEYSIDEDEYGDIVVEAGKKLTVTNYCMISKNIDDDFSDEVLEISITGYQNSYDLVNEICVDYNVFKNLSVPDSTTATDPTTATKEN